jgi:hypothetical protein
MGWGVLAGRGDRWASCKSVNMIKYLDSDPDI